MKTFQFDINNDLIFFLIQILELLAERKRRNFSNQGPIKQFDGMKAFESFLSFK